MTVRNNTVGSYTFTASSEADAVAHATGTGGTTPTPPTGTTYPIGYYTSVSNYAQSWEHPIDPKIISKYLPNLDPADQKKLVNVFETNARSLEDHLDVAYLKTSGGTVYGATTLAGDVNLLGTVRVEELPLLSLLPPTGSVTMYAGLNTPAGWLLCLGQAVSRTDYASLYANIGIYYGAGDGSTTFNLPNLQNRFPLGEVNGGSPYRGQTGGEATVTLDATNLPSHKHASGTLGTLNAGGHGHTASSGDAGGHDHTVNIPSGGSHQHTATVNQTSATSHTHVTNGTFASGLSGTGGTSTGYTSFESHSHTGTTNIELDHAHTVTVDAVGDHAHTVNGETGLVGGSGAHNNMPPYQVFKFIIKT